MENYCLVTKEFQIYKIKRIMEMYGTDNYANTLSAFNSIEFELYTQKWYKWQFCVMYIFPQLKKKKKGNIGEAE